jgi:hypothetical protein
VVGVPALGPQKSRNPAIAIPSILPGQVNDRCSQRCFVVGHPGCLALRRAVLIEHSTRNALGHIKGCRNMLDGSATTGSA